MRTTDGGVGVGTTVCVDAIGAGRARVRIPSVLGLGFGGEKVVVDMMIVWAVVVVVGAYL